LRRWSGPMARRAEPINLDYVLSLLDEERDFGSFMDDLYAGDDRAVGAVLWAMHHGRGIGFASLARAMAAPPAK
jgi:hypothetical protein